MLVALTAIMRVDGLLTAIMACKTSVPTGHDYPPIIAIISLPNHSPLCGDDILVQFALSVEVIVSLVGRWRGWRGGPFQGPDLGFDVGTGSRVQILLENPRDKNILFIGMAPSSPTVFLLQRPHKNQRLASMAFAFSRSFRWLQGL